MMRMNCGIEEEHIMWRIDEKGMWISVDDIRRKLKGIFIEGRMMTDIEHEVREMIKELE